jgi:hypothetical protein
MMHAIAEKKKALKFQELVFTLQKFWAGSCAQPSRCNGLAAFAVAAMAPVEDEEIAPQTAAALHPVRELKVRRCGLAAVRD